MSERGKIPISAARQMAQKYRCPVIVIFAIEDTGERFTMTTYGETKKLCRLAADIGSQFADAIFNEKVTPSSKEPTHLPDTPTTWEPVEEA